MTDEPRIDYMFPLHYDDGSIEFASVAVPSPLKRSHAARIGRLLDAVAFDDAGVEATRLAARIDRAIARAITRDRRLNPAEMQALGRVAHV